MIVKNFTGTLGEGKETEIHTVKEGLMLKPHGIFQLWDHKADEGNTFWQYDDDESVVIVISDIHNCQTDVSVVSLEKAEEIFNSFK